jgi:hypothetical protein
MGDSRDETVGYKTLLRDSALCKEKKASRVELELGVQLGSRLSLNVRKLL